MYKYFATRGNVVDAVTALQDDLLDFADYCCQVTEPEGRREVYGWIKTDKPVPAAQAERLGLVPAERR